MNIKTKRIISILLLTVMIISLCTVVNAEQPTDDMAAFKAKVDKLTVMKNAGLLTDEEFNGLKAELLKSIL